MYELGGGAALYALNKAPIMLPSRFTIAEARREQNLRITVGDVKVSDILENIEILFSDINTGDSGPVLHTLSQDEIAGDGRLCYLDETDEIAGLCEHASSRLKTFKMGDDLTSVEEAVKAVQAGDIHVGKEFSVAAFSRHAPDDYGAKPVPLMPTCKKGSWQSAQILQKLIQAWKLSPLGEAKHGPLAAIASDGDRRRRAALYLICMHKHLGPDDPLYEFLSDLPGLNLFTGDGGITMDFDYYSSLKPLKSYDKLLRFYVLSNTNHFTFVNPFEVSIPATYLPACLLLEVEIATFPTEREHRSLLAHDVCILNPEEELTLSRCRCNRLYLPIAYLKPAKTVGLMHVRTAGLRVTHSDLRQLDDSEFTPSEKNTHRALCLLGEMFDALVDPFINPTLSLSEQMVQLVKFAHMACALFVKHNGDFFSHQLYGDLQCMVKNMIFKIAHTKVLNPLLKVFLCLLGDDVLETLFGRSRMIGGHSPNHAIDELRQRFCSVLRMDKIFLKYPYLERRARRLQLVRSRDVDHLSPRQWEGDITAASCNIRACYTAGVDLAKSILAKYGCDMDFTARFAKEGFDLMRPKGGKYPGLSKDVDRSLIDASTTESSSSSATNDSLEAADILAFNAEIALAAEKAARAKSDADAAPEGHSIWINLTEDGRKKAHKKTILRTFMDPTFDINDGKRHDRLLRVRYYSIGGDRSLRNIGLFQQTKVSLAILQCTGIKIINTHPITYLEAAPTAEISLPDSRYEITGQILSLVPFDESLDSSEIFPGPG
ncbi:hypothetical protein B0H13DRAFT_2390241 [Mycena leptocephala]|nr:hypothetical protein B0H13DRAFT_2390241 [Mycena leptocephala]